MLAIAQDSWEHLAERWVQVGLSSDDHLCEIPSPVCELGGARWTEVWKEIHEYEHGSSESALGKAPGTQAGSSH